MSDVIISKSDFTNQLSLKVIRPDENTMELGLSDTGNDFALVPPFAILQYVFRVARILGQTVLGSQPSRKFLACAETKP
jgi:hypothetical protein